MLRDLWSLRPEAGRWHAVLALAVAVALGLAPLLAIRGEARWLDLAASVVILALLAAGHRLMAGQGGMPVYAQGAFFALGACGVALATTWLTPGWVGVATGVGAAVAGSLAIASAVAWAARSAGDGGFALASLGIALAVAALATGLPWIVDDAAIAFEVPPLLAGLSRPSVYGLLVAVALMLWLVLLRIAGSPFGRALDALRENRALAVALGYRPELYRLLTFAISAVVAAVAGGLFALWQHGSGPVAWLGIGAMLDLLLVAWIGGTRGFHGPLIGAAAVVALRAGLPPLLMFASGRFIDSPSIASALSPEHADLWFSLLWFAGVCHAMRRWLRRPASQHRSFEQHDQENPE